MTRPFSNPALLISLHRWIEEFEKKNHCKPAVDEIAVAFRTSTSVARYYLARMVDMGIGCQPTLEKNGKIVTPARSFILLPLEQGPSSIRVLLQKEK